MAKEHWYFFGGILVVLVPLLLLVTVKKLHWLEARPDQKIVYATAAGQPLTLHVFHAKQRVDHATAPALLLFHGGRWLYGNPEEYYPQCQFFAERGISCFSAQYRLGANNRPDVRGALVDARAALDYLIAHAADLRIDPVGIAVGGASSGGHLAAALGAGLPRIANSNSTRPQRPVAQVLYNPMLDLAPGTPDHHLVKDYWQEVSPHEHIDSAVPATLILVGSNDPEVPLSTAQAFCTAVETAGGHCEIALYAGQGHGFFHNPPYLLQTNQRVVEFLLQHKRI